MARTSGVFTKQQEDWQDFPSVAAGTLITATTTNPTYGTVVTNRAQYRIKDGLLDVMWHFRQTSGGSAGSGTTLFNLPPIIPLIDTAKITASTDLSNVTTWTSGTVGTIYYASDASSFQGTGTVGLYSANQFKLMIHGSNGGVSTGTLASTVTSSFYAFSSSNIAFSVIITGIPLVGRSAKD